MIYIDYEDYTSISQWIKKANNFIESQSDMDGNISWFVLRNGCRVMALELLTEEHIHTYVSPENYRVDEDVYVRWKELFGYEI